MAECSRFEFDGLNHLFTVVPDTSGLPLIPTGVDLLPGGSQQTRKHILHKPMTPTGEGVRTQPNIHGSFFQIYQSDNTFFLLWRGSFLDLYHIGRCFFWIPLEPAPLPYDSCAHDRNSMSLWVCQVYSLASLKPSCSNFCSLPVRSLCVPHRSVLTGVLDFFSSNYQIPLLFIGKAHSSLSISNSRSFRQRSISFSFLFRHSIKNIKILKPVAESCCVAL